MVVVLLLSLVVGAVLVELVLRTFGGSWFRGQIGKMTGQLRDYLAARTDDERQQRILSTGLHTLRFSAVSLAWVCALTAVATLGPWILRWDEAKQVTYFVAVSVVATVWWLLRYRYLGGGFRRSDS